MKLYLIIHNKNIRLIFIKSFKIIIIVLIELVYLLHRIIDKHKNHESFPESTHGKL